MQTQIKFTRIYQHMLGRGMDKKPSQISTPESVVFFFPPIDIKHTALTDRTVFRKLVILITATRTELLSLSSEVSIYQAESLPSPAETQPPQSHRKSTTRDNLGQLYACFGRESMSNLVLPCLTPTPPPS